ncbi:MAG: amidohydrolase family protein [Planctomycetia bacterium]|nr:amidohydrolase family protein [Planctomycetia bacterium]
MRIACALAIFGIALMCGAAPARAVEPPDTILLGGRIVTLDARESVAEAIAIQGGRIAAVGTTREIEKLGGPKTEIIRLDGKIVLPGFIESHCHAVGVARDALAQTYVELSSIGEVQQWIRRRATEIPAGQWIEVPRNEITRFTERRFPTPAELDAACTTHPVLYTSVANKHVLNSLGFERAGVAAGVEKLGDGEVLRDGDGRPLLLRGGTAAIRAQIPVRAEPPRDDVLASLARLLATYNGVGITSIFERATDAVGLKHFDELRLAGKLTTRVTGTFRFSARNAEGVEKFVAGLGWKPGEGDEWIKAGPLKITVDGGIHWGTTRLSEPYGPRRIAFYRLTDPAYRGELYYPVEQMQEVFATAHRLGWQMSCHVTGDDGTARVLDALEAAAAAAPDVAKRRFTLIHSYFPDAAILRRCKALGVCVDTQGYLYYRDADTLADIYGQTWADRFIGLGDWVRGGIPVGLNADHMIGFDPDHAMNSFNPFLMLSIAVTRRTKSGHVHGPHQKLSRLDALRTVTQWPAYMSFDEKNLGSLEPGKLADLVVIDKDYLTCPDEQIATLKAVRTIVGGRTVWPPSGTTGKE